ncbi:hypothetical protein [Halovenus halobia]|uniref:hypothetical protein n=1 Tax=Halovenus halobia TaxID=3396622 RepID=UPI003F56B998
MGLLNPSTAFPYAARALVPEFAEITLLPEPSAVYLQNWICFVVLAAWLVVSLSGGYLRFARRDLG